MSFHGKNVLITGAASGIGRSLAQIYAQKKANLTLIDIQEKKLQDVTSSLETSESKILSLSADVSNDCELKEAIETSVQFFNQIDVCVANAGLCYETPMERPDLEKLSNIIDVNLKGVVNTVSLSIPALLESRGHIAIVSSVAGFAGLPGGAGYCLSKSAVATFAESCRLDLADLGVGVSCIYPAWVETPMTNQLDDQLQYFKVSVDTAAKQIFEAINKQKRTVVFPWQASLLFNLLPFLPRSVIELITGTLPQPFTSKQS